MLLSDQNAAAGRSARPIWVRPRAGSGRCAGSAESVFAECDRGRRFLGRSPGELPISWARDKRLSDSRSGKLPYSGGMFTMRRQGRGSRSAVSRAATESMGLTYFKRYRLEISLTGSLFDSPGLPPHYTLHGWSPALLESHAEAKYCSFRREIDSNVFPCLGERAGCRRLMEEITGRDAFVATATWLLRHQPPGHGGPENCGTVQGIRDDYGYGAVQNLGVTPAHRCLGLGSVLLYHALDGFRSVGLRRAYLEVTSQNTAAIRLYLRLGFRQVKTVYKAVEVAYA